MSLRASMGSAAYDAAARIVNSPGSCCVASRDDSCYAGLGRWLQSSTFVALPFHTLPIRLLALCQRNIGALMKVSLSFKHVELREPIETEVARHLEKLNRLLKSYSPDLVQVHGSVEKHPRKSAYIFTANLSLPTGTLHATGEGPDVRQSVKTAFAEISSQLKKHQAKVRRDYQWKRKRAVPALVER